jgi:hypothetical protein
MPFFAHSSVGESFHFLVTLAEIFRIRILQVSVADPSESFHTPADQRSSYLCDRLNSDSVKRVTSQQIPTELHNGRSAGKTWGSEQRYPTFIS